MSHSLHVLRDRQAIFRANAVEIIALVAELAPKVIGTGKSVVDLWQSAGGISAAAEKTGKVDADAALRLKALVDVQMTALDRNAAEAEAGR